MEHFKEYFTFLQKFDLRVIEGRDKRKSSKDGPVYGMGYDIRHQNPFFSFQFLNQLRILKDLAVIDIISADPSRRRSYLDQTKKILAQFKRFWDKYFLHNPRASETFQDNYLLVIEFGEIFYTNILEPGKTGVIVTWEFVEDLCDSIRTREESLAQFIDEIHALEKIVANGATTEVPKTEYSQVRVRRHPVFVEGIADQFFKIFKEYFDEQYREALYSLLSSNISPKKKLLFNSNGNQLADAFKQLFEANLIVSCNKAELESWIIEHFQYVSNSLAKPFTAGYLNGIISSDVKICKSPIFSVNRNGEKGLALVSVQRTKKGSDT